MTAILTLHWASDSRGYENVKFWEVDFASFATDITFGEHCHACTAGRYGRCHGALINVSEAGEVKKQLYVRTGETKTIHFPVTGSGPGALLSVSSLSWQSEGKYCFV